MSKNSNGDLSYSMLMKESSSSVKKSGADKEYARLGFNLDQDIYDATLVAAFGGVFVGTNHDEDQEPVHAFLMFIPSMLLFLLQGFLLVALCLDLKLSHDIRLEHARADTLLLWIKGSVYFIVQLQLFSSMQGTLNLLVFVMTPSTWDYYQVIRPDPEEMNSTFKWTFHTCLVLPWPIISLFMKLTIDYTVCVTSLSVILLAEDAVDALFNSLAITWIADIDVLLWDALSTIAVLDRKHAEDFRFQYRIGNQDERAEARQARNKCNMSSAARSVVHFFMLIIYWRQCAIFQMAIDTNNIPAARDVCTAWRWIEGPDAWPISKAFLNLFPWWDVIGNALVKNADPEQGGYCDENYMPMSLGDMFFESWKHPELIYSMIVLAVLLYSPHLITVISRNFGKKEINVTRGWIKSDSDTSDDDKIASLGGKLVVAEQKMKKHKVKHQKRIAELEERLLKLEAAGRDIQARPEYSEQGAPREWIQQSNISSYITGPAYPPMAYSQLSANSAPTLHPQMVTPQPLSSGMTGGYVHHRNDYPGVGLDSARSLSRGATLLPSLPSGSPLQAHGSRTQRPIPPTMVV